MILLNLTMSAPETIEQKTFLEVMMEKKNWTSYQLAVEYGKQENPDADILPADHVKKYGSSIRRVLRNPEKASFETVKKLVELLGGKIIIRQFDDVCL